MDLDRESCFPNLIEQIFSSSGFVHPDTFNLIWNNQSLTSKQKKVSFIRAQSGWFNSSTNYDENSHHYNYCKHCQVDSSLEHCLWLCPTLSEQRDRLILDLTLIQRDIKVTWESDFNEHDISVSPRGSLSKNAVVRISKENVFKIHSIIFKWIMDLRCFE